MNTQTKTKDKLSSTMRASIAEAVRDILEDPDFGLSLRDEVKQRLQKTAKSRQKGISLFEIKRKYL
jgi:hypothetical protein